MIKKTIFLFFLLNILIFPAKKVNDLKFKRFSIEHGLSQSTIKSIVQDNTGYLWFGTSGGLNRYNGKTFKIYKREEGNNNSLYSSYIRTMFLDSKNNLWIGTKKGLNKYNPAKDNFDKYLDIGIVSIYESPNNTLIIGTNSGLYYLNKLNNKFEKNEFVDKSLSFISSITAYNDFIWFVGNNKLFSYNTTQNIVKESDLLKKDEVVNKIYTDSKNNLWIGTTTSLYKLNDKLIKFDYKGINCFYEDSKNKLWIGTDLGLLKYNHQNNDFLLYTHNDLDHSSLISNKILSIYEDSSNNLWIGTYIAGLSKLGNFKYYRNNPNDQNSIINNTIFSIHKSSDNEIWIGTRRGLTLYNKNNNTYKHFFKGEFIWTVSEDKNNIWVGTNGNGFFSLNKSTFKTKQFKYDNYHKRINRILKIYNTNDGFLWIGTYGGGLNCFNLKTEEIKNFIPEPNNKFSIADKDIWDITEDKDGYLWLGTEDNVFIKFDRKTEKFYNFTHLDIKNYTSWVIEDGIGDILWIGTWDRGLIKFNKKTEHYELITEKQGLPDNTIYGLVKENEFLWLSSDNGLTKYNTLTGKMIIYDINDGLQNNEFNIGAYHKGKDGEILFGGISGLNSFYSKSSEFNTPEIVIDEFKVLNKNRKIQKNINLKHNENFFSFDFSLLDFINPDKNQYKYKLQGLDNSWIYDTKGFANYTNISPGKYVFKVIGANSRGVWNVEGVEISLTVKPAFYNSIAAYILYFLVLGSIILTLINYQIKLKAKELAAGEMKKAKEFAEKTAQLKSSFFANMSHEIRTPMYGILGAVEILSKTDLNKYQEKFLKVIKGSGNSMLKLINEILDFSKIEAKKLVIEKIDFNFKNLINEINTIYNIQCNNKNVEYIFNIDESIPNFIKSDPVRIRQLLDNFLSNAIKYTKSGQVELNINVLSKNENSLSLKFSIIDTGIGIKEENIDNIFSRFEQSNSSDYRNYGGTGLGLSISKGIIDKMQGKVNVKSEVNIGSEFSFELTVEESEIKTNYIENNQYDLRKKLNLKILVVEDDSVTGMVICEILRYMGIDPTLVNNGNEAIINLKKNKYDLIISDVQMPELNGIDLVNLIKEKGYKSKIILMSANNLKEDEQKSLNIDDFILKPIDTKELYNKLLKLTLTDKHLKDTKELFLKKRINQKLILHLEKYKSETIISLKDAFEKMDKIKLKKLIHKIKGSIKQWGNDSSIDIIENLDIMFKNDNFIEFKSQIELLEKEIDNIKDELNNSN